MLRVPVPDEVCSSKWLELDTSKVVPLVRRMLVALETSIAPPLVSSKLDVVDRPTSSNVVVVGATVMRLAPAEVCIRSVPAVAPLPGVTTTSPAVLRVLSPPRILTAPPLEPVDPAPAPIDTAPPVFDTPLVLPPTTRIAAPSLADEPGESVMTPDAVVAVPDVMVTDPVSAPVAAPLTMEIAPVAVPVSVLTVAVVPTTDTAPPPAAMTRAVPVSWSSTVPSVAPMPGRTMIAPPDPDADAPANTFTAPPVCPLPDAAPAMTSMSTAADDVVVVPVTAMLDAVSAATVVRVKSLSASTTRSDPADSVTASLAGPAPVNVKVDVAVSDSAVAADKPSASGSGESVMSESYLRFKHASAAWYIEG